MMSSGEHKLVSIAPHKDYRRCAVTLLCLRVFAMFVFDPETQTEAQLHASQVDTWTEAVLFPADASDKKRSTQAHKHDDTRWLTDVLRKGLIEGAQVIPERLHNLNLPTQIRTDATVELFAGECRRDCQHRTKLIKHAENNLGSHGSVTEEYADACNVVCLKRAFIERTT